MSNLPTDIVCRITHAGLLAASNNPPNRNGFKIEIYQAKAYDNLGVLKGTYSTTGYRLRDGTVRVNVMISAVNGNAFDLYRIDLIDKTSNVVFAQIRREDNSIIDEIYGKKKTMLNYYLKLGLIDDQIIEITVSGDDESLIAMKYLDEHILDKDAHSKPATLTASTSNDVVNGLHTHEVEKGTTAKKGLVRFATVAEAKAGTDTDSAVTPQGLKAAIDEIPTVAEATTERFGVVELATAEDIINRTPNKVVTAEMLTHISKNDVIAAEMTLLNATLHKADLTFTPPFNCKKLAIRGFVQTVRGHVGGNCNYTFQILNPSGAVVATFVRENIGHRDGDSGHGYYHNWYIPLDCLQIAASLPNLPTIGGAKVFAGGQDYKIRISANDSWTIYNLTDNHGVTIDCYG